MDVAVDVRLSGSFGQNRVRWPARPRVRLAKIAHIGRRRLGFVRPPCIPATGTPRVRLAKVLQLAPPGVAEKARDPPPLHLSPRKDQVDDMDQLDEGSRPGSGAGLEHRSA